MTDLAKLHGGDFFDLEGHLTDEAIREFAAYVQGNPGIDPELFWAMREHIGVRAYSSDFLACTKNCQERIIEAVGREDLEEKAILRF